MRGRRATKREYFVSVRVDEYVPEGHLLRALDHFLGLSEFRPRIAGSYRHTGRPSIDRELMIRMQLLEAVLRRCILEDLMRGEGFATDAGFIKADAQGQRGKVGVDAARISGSSGALLMKIVRVGFRVGPILAVPLERPKL